MNGQIGNLAPMSLDCSWTIYEPPRESQSRKTERISIKPTVSGKDAANELAGIYYPSVPQTNRLR